LSKTNTAQLEITEETPQFTPALLQHQVAERLAAHRSRRTRLNEERSGTDGARTIHVDSDVSAPVSSRSERIAAAVAERFAQSQSYRAFLATEAEKAIRVAEAAAEMAARNARVVAETQQQLLDDLYEIAAQQNEAPARVRQGDSRDGPRPVVLVPDELGSESFGDNWTKPAGAEDGSKQSSHGLVVRLYEDIGRPAAVLPVAGKRSDAASIDEAVSFAPTSDHDVDEHLALEEELAFRLSANPQIEVASTPIPGNLLEFPRQLVATRKVRPRYAEGPLREEADLSREGTQLRIFEVEADQINLAPAVESAAPEWSSIWLDALTKSSPEEPHSEPVFVGDLRPQTAPIRRRAMAGLVDASLVGAGFVAFATGVAYAAPVLPSRGLTALAGCAALVSLYLIYHLLFFTYSDATPGMRYARIGLCTFGDDNPTRSAMRRRMLAFLFAACPMAIGLLWAWLDDDRLGWHDRISRMYQRCY
jgi:uncharacterized RDD family membrane protein YckC